MPRIPLIHLTDLYHPPQDPDDHIDLATLFALPEFDVRAIILDPNRRALQGSLNEDGHTLDPGFIPVAQLNYLTGRAIPVGAGPVDPLRNPSDTAADRPLHEQGGIELLLRTLRECERKTCISVVSSLRPLTAAFNRDPELFRKKVDRVLLNAGSSGSYLEWNVELDPAAYVGLLRSGLPIDWYPCANDKSPFEADPHNTYWKAPQADLFRNLPPRLCAWFSYAFSDSQRSDIIHLLNEEPDNSAWQRILSQTRNMWSTASLVIAAGRTLTHTREGWQFVPASQKENVSNGVATTETWSLENVSVIVNDQGITSWKKTDAFTGTRLFHRTGPTQEPAMIEALNSLLHDLKITRR